MTTKQIIVFGILICLLTATAYYAGYSHGYNQGKEDWFSIGEMAGRTNEIADRLHDYLFTEDNYIKYNYPRNWTGNPNTTYYEWSTPLFSNTTTPEVSP